MRPAPSWEPYPSVVQVGFIQPEPVEQTRFLLALVAPFVVVGLWLALRRWCRSRRRSPRVPTWSVLVVQVVLAAVVIASWISQKRSHEWFADRTLLIAAGLGSHCWPWPGGWIVPRPPGEEGTRGHPLIGGGIAFVLTGYWLLPAVYRTPTAVNVPAELGILAQIQFLQDKLVSVLNGRTPMVDFAVQ